MVVAQRHTDIICLLKYNSITPLLFGIHSTLHSAVGKVHEKKINTKKTNKFIFNACTRKHKELITTVIIVVMVMITKVNNVE